MLIHKLEVTPGVEIKKLILKNLPALGDDNGIAAIQHEETAPNKESLRSQIAMCNSPR